MKQIPLAIGPESRPSFDNFVPGANAAALQHLAGLALPSAPVYLWGPAASGKTHLMQALAARCQAAGQTAAWFDAADPEPWTLQPHWALVVVDRCVPPVDLPLREDLRTRLGWGHVFALEPLADSETRAALRREADHRGIFLPDEVMDYLLVRFPRDLGHLMQVLDRLDEFGLAKGRRITLPLVRQMLAEEGLPEGGA